MNTLDMAVLESSGVRPLESRAMVETNGGMWAVLGGILIAIAYDIINNPEDAIKGFDDGWAAGGK